MATGLFGGRGYGATSVREVVEAAGVTKPTLYYYFANKEALFLEAVYAQIRGMQGLLGETLGGEGTPVERLRTFVGRYVREALGDRDGVMLMMACQHPAADGQPQVDLLSVHTDTLEAVARVVSEGVDGGGLRAELDPLLAAVSLVGAANLLIVGGLHGLPVDEDAADAVFELFLNGAGRA